VHSRQALEELEPELVAAMMAALAKPLTAACLRPEALFAVLAIFLEWINPMNFADRRLCRQHFHQGCYSTFALQIAAVSAVAQLVPAVLEQVALPRLVQLLLRRQDCIRGNQNRFFRALRQDHFHQPEDEALALAVASLVVRSPAAVLVEELLALVVVVLAVIALAVI
jgi:hypothetical protein